MRVRRRIVGGAAAVLFLCAVLSGCGGGGGDANPPPPPPPVTPPPPPPPVAPPAPTTLGAGPESCTDGEAGDFACRGISLEKRVSLATMEGTSGNDVWGWRDSLTGKEYALMGMTNGTAFVDVSEPQSPLYLGRLPTETSNSVWRDIKVYRDHAYIVADNAGAHGMQVFDLTRLRGLSGPADWSPDMVYDGFRHSHNLAINEDTGFAYAVSTDTCDGGLHIMNIKTPINPMFAGCHEVTRTHDTQCVVYRGPDEEHRDREICFSSNENHVEVVDVTDKSAPLTLSSSTYPQMGYVHQGWLTEDHRYFLLGDELDETNFGLTTRTHVFDVSDLDSPEHLYAHDLGTQATDHNLYVQGNRVFEANYSSGLRVLEFGDLTTEDIREIAFFDTFPSSNTRSLQGAWSVYPYLPSGTLLVSDMQNGLFVLSMQ
ncbi:MAG: choice-of-anchor B family protein [Gammaproteobacteria bacterium]|nr:choice-of-anchor B family protein [Gammaproteobacteria bacterium]